MRISDWSSDVCSSDLLFESVSEGFGALQDALRADSLQVIGGSAFGDRLENDRAFAQQLLAGLGFPAGHIHEFNDAGEADRFIDTYPKCYVLKFSGPDFVSRDNYFGWSADGQSGRA